MKAMRAALDAPEPVVWSLALDEIQATGVDLRPRLPFNGPRDFTGPDRVSLRAASGSALDDSPAHPAGPAHRGRRSQFPVRDRESTQRARSRPHRTGAALLSESVYSHITFIRCTKALCAAKKEHRVSAKAPVSYRVMVESLRSKS